MVASGTVGCFREIKITESRRWPAAQQNWESEETTSLWMCKTATLEQHRVLGEEWAVNCRKRDFTVK